MKVNVFLSRHRRLLVLCAVSAALHGALLELAARRTPGPFLRTAASAPLALRLVDSAPHAKPSAPTLARPVPRPAAPARATAPASPPRRTAPASASAPSANIAPAAAAPAQPAPVPGERVLMQMPGRYRVRTPPSARLGYDVLLQGRPAQAQRAYLDWHSDGSSYTLEVDGLLGRLSSRGLGGDTGLVPELAIETQGDRTLRTSFDPDTGEIRFDATGAGAPGNIGMQDRASVLLQLAAIGRGSQEQLQDEIAIVVAGASTAAIERYQVLGQEDVETGIGSMPAWHLAQVAAPGQARLELWLAPSQDWLPVQLRLTAPDGSVATQVLASAERAGVLP